MDIIDVILTDILVTPAKLEGFSRIQGDTKCFHHTLMSRTCMA